ncbi:MAG: hypothetical protein J6B77_06755 [Clostridia bacterium]|nr:hypothetical protein [Clostridia bacterium]
MKKIFAFLLVFVLMFSFVACSNTGNGDETTTEADAGTTDEVTTAGESGNDDVKVLTYAEYAAIDISEGQVPVIIEAYVQATQGWWSKDGQGVITAYLQDRDGAYFAYEMNCEEADAARLVPGTKIRVNGYKTAWSGEIEIIDASFEFVEDADTYIAEALDVTDILGTDDLIKHQNKFVSFSGVVAKSEDKDGNEVAFLYNWDGSGEKGNDLYFNVTVGENTYNVCVESYLCGQDTDVYKAVEALEIGAEIDLEGFLYWYDGVNPHITSVTPSAE